MPPTKFRKGQRVVGIDTKGEAHHGVVETVWRRLNDTIYGVRFDEINKRLRVEEIDLRLEDEYVAEEVQTRVLEVQ